MTVNELYCAYAERGHFVISIHDEHKDTPYDYEQTFFTVGDYEAIENTAMENAEAVTPVYHFYEVPDAVLALPVSEFFTFDDVLIIIIDL